MTARQVREYPHLAELLDAATKHCAMYAAQRIVVDNCLSTDEEAAASLYDMLQRIQKVRSIVEQKPAV
ncbi:MAG: hypothetical protein V2I26_08985 [Halieaceae bacterium]|jgi:hypothetical protein|nr:hypothetical protein [Halieaceae bacterium]